jgi:Flp pilus assembly protein TadD
MKDRGGWLWPLTLSLAALVFWVVFLGQAENSVFGRVPILDEVYYLDRAAAWTEESPGYSEPYFISPLYPILISLAGSGESVPDSRVFPPAQLRGIRLFQIACWLGVVILLRLIAGRILGREVEPGWKNDLILWLPAVMFALYRPAAVYAVSILLELPLVLLVTAAVYLMICLADRVSGPGRGFYYPLVLGGVLGLAGLLRGTALLLLVPALVLAARNAVGRKDRLGRVLLVLAAVFVVLAPAVIHNSRIAGRPTGPTLNAGVNLYIGNGPAANGFYVAVVPGDWRHDPAGREYLAERRGGPVPSLAAADRIWGREAWRAMAENPARTAGLWLKKVWLHLQGWEIDQLTPLAGWRNAAPVLAWMPVPFALLVALGLGGAVGRWRDPRVRWLVAAVAVLVAGQSLFFVVSRYRLAMVPVLCLLATAGVVEILQKNRWVVLVSILAVIITIPWGLEGTRKMWRAQALANEALRWAEIGDQGNAGESTLARETAEYLYRESLANKAAGSAPWLGLAALLIEDGRREEAAEILAEGAGVTFRNLEINKALLALWLEDGRRAEALELTRAILEDHPRDADTLHNRTVLLAESGRGEEALEVARDLVGAHPGDARGYIDLGIILARAGRRQEARAVFQQGLAAAPGNPLLQRNLELLEN